MVFFVQIVRYMDGKEKKEREEKEENEKKEEMALFDLLETRRGRENEYNINIQKRPIGL